MTMTSTALKTWTIEGTDADGAPDVTTLVIVPAIEGFELARLHDGQHIDGSELDTLAEAVALAEEWAAEIRSEYRQTARELVRARRSERRQLLLDAAEEMDGLDAQAARKLASLLGRGQAAQALEALKKCGLA